MRIAIIHPGMDVKGGAENIVVWLADGLIRRGHVVQVIADRYTPALWPAERLGKLDVRLMPVSILNRVFNSRRLRHWDHVRQLKKMLRKFDVVIGQHFPTYTWAAQARGWQPWRLVWLCQEPLRRLHPDVTDAHLLDYQRYTPAGVENDHLYMAATERLRGTRHRRMRTERNRRWDIAGARQCDMIVTNSAFTGDNVRRIFGREPVVCHLGVPLAAEPEYCRGDYAAVLTTLAIRKNVYNVIRAMDVLVNRRGRKDIRLRIGGRGPDRDELEKNAADLGLKEHVEFIGGMPDEDLPEFYRRARLVVYCPIDEPFGLVPLEALAQKTPVVVSNHGGPSEVVEHGVMGLHVNPFDPNDIADGIQALWDDESKARAMAEAGCARIRGYYSLDAFVDRFQALVAESPLRQSAGREHSSG